MPCDCGPGEVSGNEVSNIPIKQGFPLSTPCERATIMGAIPEVIRYPAFTLVRGATIVSKESNGGILNPTSFWKPRAGCYYDKNAQLAGCNSCQ